MMAGGGLRTWFQGERGTGFRVGAALGVALAMATIGAAAVLRPPEAYLPRSPERTPFSAPVENRMLDVRITARGQVRADAATTVECAPVGDAASQTRVFTKPLTPGQAVKEGDVLAAVNGRPVIVLQGGTAAFRDILPGSTGSDVQQLQDALRRLGLLTGTDKDGTYGAGTQAAVDKLFDQRGFRAQGPTREESSRVSAARFAAAQADASVAQAKAALDTATATRKAEKLNAQIAVKQAVANQAQAVAPAEKEIADLGLRAAQLHLDEVTRRTSAPEYDALSLAKTVSAQSHDELAHLQRTVGTSVPFCEVLFVPTLPASVRAPQQATSDAGAAASHVWATLTSANLVLDVELTASDAALVRAGAKAGIRFDGATQDQASTVADVTPKQTGGAVARVRPDAPFPADAPDANVRVTIDVSSSEGNVLVVPLAAVAGDAGGDAKVTTMDESGHESQVLVTAGLASGGYVQVTPLVAGQLKEGDRVRLGS